MTFDSRANYLKAHLLKTLPPEAVDPTHLTYETVMRAPSTLLEYWETVRKADVQNALAQPRHQKAVQASKDNAAFERFWTGKDWNQEDHNQLVESLRRVKAEFPALVHNDSNSRLIADWLLEQRLYPTYDHLVLAVTTLISSSKLFVDPSRVIPNFRLGEEGITDIRQLTAAELKAITTPYRPANDESKLSAAEYWKAHPELAAERYKHDRAAVQRDLVRRGAAEVERFLLTQLNYLPDDRNRTLMLDYLDAHSLPMTAEALMQAFAALKPQLAQSDKAVSYGSTTVVDLGARRENPSYVSTELKDSIRRKIARYSSTEYNDWLVRHPEEAAIIDEG